ncbi:endolytic transglycosylase MltG [Mesorhizobium sp. NBSH29]|uniref:endolytic transglycosylase MltG n=1 Tax=Mesorhizobium sp. NBSH29 TaxID=2654249 RepID=UPI00189698D7|nr:endolytic transglycosylase MltG [Mesorhizobium sp. NBSH29]QPC87313.1 endolytic transglycosylase MltG [Mesorhizobium sp. NBSH29]
MNTTPDNQTEFGKRATAATPIVPKSASEALRPENGTPPPAKRQRSRRARSQFIVFLNLLMSTVVLTVLAAGAVVYVGKLSFEGKGPSATPATYLVKPRSGWSETADQLERRGLISDARIFQMGVRAYGNSSALKAGEYEIKPGASMHEVMDALTSGKSILYSVTIPEGLTVQQIWQRIAENEALTGDMPAEMPPEGTLAADTVRVTRGTPREQVIDKLKADQKKLVEEIWERRASGLPIETIEEFVTLASIVEKETGRGDERSRVASVFINRLNKGMRLQSDPTIIYGIFGGAGKPADRPIYKSEITKPTPYNTYVIDRLPPTPIANPGRAALEAVANPSQTKDIYFVADGTGAHVFAETLDEHNANVARYRAAMKKQAEEAAETKDGDAEKPAE